MLNKCDCRSLAWTTLHSAKWRQTVLCTSYIWRSSAVKWVFICSPTHRFYGM